jgi:hypothetical protein
MRRRRRSRDRHRMRSIPSRRRSPSESLDSSMGNESVISRHAMPHGLGKPVPPIRRPTPTRPRSNRENRIDAPRPGRRSRSSTRDAAVDANVSVSREDPFERTIGLVRSYTAGRGETERFRTGAGLPHRSVSTNRGRHVPCTTPGGSFVTCTGLASSVAAVSPPSRSPAPRGKRMGRRDVGRTCGPGALCSVCSTKGKMACN